MTARGFSCLTALYLIFFNLVLAAPQPGHWNKSRQECTTKSARKPWQQLTPSEQEGYIQGELCLMSLPPKFNLPGARNRWEELQYTHLIQTDFIHDVGAFLPWHRYIVTLHANLLRDECGYEGAIPYWVETQDVGKLAESVLFKPEFFGGNGAANDTKHCITDGPFANVSLHLKRPHAEPEPYCISREFNDTTLAFHLESQEYLDACFAMENYTTAWQCWHAAPHGGGHAGIGALMGDLFVSPGDPLFYMHHTWLDALWWKWQSMDLPARLTEMDGRNIPSEAYRKSFKLDLPGPELVDYCGDPGNVTTLDHVLWLAGMAPNVTVRDVMDIGGPVVCAEYFYDE